MLMPMAVLVLAALVLFALTMVGARVGGVQPEQRSASRAAATTVFELVVISGLILGFAGLASNNPHFEIQMTALCGVAFAVTVVAAKTIYATTWASSSVVVAAPTCAVGALAWLLLHDLRITF